MAPVILVPAYQPAQPLVDLVAELLAARPGLDVLVVDDGSGPAYRPIFAAAAGAGAHVHHLLLNQGKGHALKTGFALLERLGRPVVTADADGQHAVADILRVADAIGPEPDHLVLGVRAFDTAVPARSRLGNDATRLLFRLATGQRLQDTQTGLRGFPAGLLGWLGSVEGDRYEYELTMLLRAARAGIELRSVPITTIYLDDNASSHFRPVRDSVRIYAPLLVFLGSSLLAFAVDTVALLTLDALFGSLLLAVLGARLISARVNFAVNRRWVFDRRRQVPTGRAARRYAALAVTLLALNYALLATTYALGLPLLLAKLLTEAVLVTLSYAVQARLVFSSARTVASADRSEVGS